ncbi:MAG: Glycerol-3-phosphate acyltransferase [Synergistetes bacterium ADurb.BinA166]|nr:MAG: Glycerol-3-phosphate acyltransferase [Synergistetes bacterium ADurb.BinA166]
MNPLHVILPAAGFLSGSIPWSFLAARSRGVDLRKTGSGNVGATNLFRSCGKTVGAAGLLLDALKGALPALASRLLGLGDIVLAATVVAAVLGHVFTPWLGFRGGKGVATALGGVAVMAPVPLLIALAAFVVVLLIWRLVSLSSIVAALVLVAATILPPGGGGSLPGRIACLLIAALILVRHAGNMGRILAGTEKRLWGAM